MARAFHLISLAPNLAEALLVTGQARTEEYRAELDRRGPTQPLPFSPRALERLLGQIGRTSRPLVVILPSKAVSFRKVRFPFSNPKRILQALDFELENELLSRLDQYLYSYKIHPQADQSALVMTYLVEQAVLDMLMRTCTQRQTAPYKITFSAYALYQSTPIHSPLHFQVYAGAEETFISLMQGNRLQSVKTFPFNPIERILTATEGEVRTPREFIALLDRRRGRRAESVPEADPAASPKPPGLTAPFERRQHSESDRMLYLYRFRADLESIVADLNQFMRLHALNEPFTISVHGMFAPFLHWEEATRELRMLTDPGEIHPPARDGMGVLEELQAHAQELAGPAVIGFQRRRAGWWQAFAELRRPLAVLGTALALFLALVGGNVSLRLSGMQGELERVQGELRAALLSEVPGAPAEPAAALQALRRRVEQSRQSQNADSRFVSYDHEILSLLQELSALLARQPGLTVESLSFGAERFSLSGKTPSYNDSESLRSSLAQLERFKGREAKITHQRTRQDIAFRISIER
jgi:Tfp pilus assembly protein PilN